MAAKNSKKKSSNNLNLLPPQLAVYEKINYKKATRIEKKSEKESNQIQENLPDFLAPDPSMMHENIQEVNNEINNSPNRFPENLISQ